MAELGENSEGPCSSKRVRLSLSHTNVYPTNNKCRGVAVIINIEHFTSVQAERKGSGHDVERLRKTLEDLEFTTVVHIDLSRDDVLRALEDVKTEDLEETDCFIVAYMSHGNYGCLWASDAPFDLNLLWEPFSGQNCPALIGKPKIFVIQACLGSAEHQAVTLQHDNSTEATPKTKHPEWADFLMAFSTTPKHVAYRDTETGSVFIQELCYALDEYGATEDICSILKQVNRVVADHNFRGNFKQMPFTVSTLRRHVRFPRKRKTQSREENGDENTVSNDGTELEEDGQHAMGNAAECNNPVSSETKEEEIEDEKINDANSQGDEHLQFAK